MFFLGRKRCLRCTISGDRWLKWIGNAWWVPYLYAFTLHNPFSLTTMSSRWQYWQQQSRYRRTVAPPLDMSGELGRSRAHRWCSTATCCVGLPRRSSWGHSSWWHVTGNRWSYAWRREGVRVVLVIRWSLGWLPGRQPLWVPCLSLGIHWMPWWFRLFDGVLDDSII